MYLSRHNQMGPCLRHHGLLPTAGLQLFDLCLLNSLDTQSSALIKDAMTSRNVTSGYSTERINMKLSHRNQHPGLPRLATSRSSLSTALFAVVLVFVLGVFDLSYFRERSLLGGIFPSLKQNPAPPDDARVVRHYNLTVGARWMNPGMKLMK